MPTAYQPQDRTKESKFLNFRCNICGSQCKSKLEELGREQISCRCGSTMRTRAIIHMLSNEIFKSSFMLPEFPLCPEIHGIGMSDWEGYASGLAKKFSYHNTFFHSTPKLDIMNINKELENKYDFIISSDIFELVPPPVSLAFRNTWRMLKPGGVLIFSAPYSHEESTKEHYPDLYDYRLEQRFGRYRLKNITRTGEAQLFKDLVFHGGPGQTLEMREFSEKSLLEEFSAAGFLKPTIYRKANLDHGIVWNHTWSLPMSVRRSYD